MLRGYVIHQTGRCVEARVNGQKERRDLGGAQNKEVFMGRLYTVTHGALQAPLAAVLFAQCSPLSGAHHLPPSSGQAPLGGFWNRGSVESPKPAGPGDGLVRRDYGSD